MDWAVRQATPETAPIVRDIARESWYAAYGDILEPDRVREITDEWYAIDGLAESIADAAETDGETFLVALPDDSNGAASASTGVPSASASAAENTVGFAHAATHPTDDSADETVASLFRLYARPSVWDTGVGTTLLERLEDDLQPACNRLCVTVLADNEIGRSFYESAGFERVETRPSELAAGLEECIYEKRL